MRILVTGGAGFIGSHLVDAFLAKGHVVEVIDDLSTGSRDNLPRDVPLHALDIRDANARAIFERFRPEVLCHQAAQLDLRKSIDDPMFDAEVNIVASLRLFEHCRAVGTQRVLFASSGGAIYSAQSVFPAPDDHPERPLSPYGVAKLTVERYLDFYRAQYGFRAACMRYSNVYGPRQNTLGEAGVVAVFAHKLLTGQTPTIFGDGEQTRDFVYVGDVVNANLAALEHDLVGSFNVSTGVETNVNQLYRLMAQALGSSMEAVHAAARAGEQLRSSLDAGKLTRASNWRPQTALAQGLKITCDYFKARH
jgi:UDP-glucose 4-epimerase